MCLFCLEEGTVGFWTRWNFLEGTNIHDAPENDAFFCLLLDGMDGVTAHKNKNNDSCNNIFDYKRTIRPMYTNTFCLCHKWITGVF